MLAVASARFYVHVGSDLAMKSPLFQMSYFGKQKRHFYKPKCSLHFLIITAATPARSHRYWRSGFVIHTNAQKEKNMHQVNNELADLCFLLWNRVFLTASGAYLWQYIPLSGLWMFPQYWYYKARDSHTLSYFLYICILSNVGWKAHYVVCSLPCLQLKGTKLL